MACVLVVEDETPLLMLAEEMLEQAGHQVLAAQSFVEARTIIQSSDSIDLVFTDVQLGPFAHGGFALGELIRQTTPGTPVLYTSGTAARREPFLPKPYTPDQLTRAVIELLSH